MKVQCDECGEQFEPSPGQRRLLESAQKKGMKMVMLECAHCGLACSVSVSAVDPRAGSRSSPTFRCPAVGCSGWLADIRDVPTGDVPQRWGCGECGRTWRTDTDLFRDIGSIVERFDHRAKVYVKKGRRWYPAPLEEQPENYEMLVERERSHTR